MVARKGKFFVSCADNFEIDIEVIDSTTLDCCRLWFHAMTLSKCTQCSFLPIQEYQSTDPACDGAIKCCNTTGKHGICRQVNFSNCGSQHEFEALS